MLQAIREQVRAQSAYRTRILALHPAPVAQLDTPPHPDAARAAERMEARLAALDGLRVRLVPQPGRSVRSGGRPRDSCGGKAGEPRTRGKRGLRRCGAPAGEAAGLNPELLSQIDEAGTRFCALLAAATPARLLPPPPARS